jgi:hypothetical protein
MLSAIVQKVTGEKIIDYLTPRLFTPLGIEGMDWEQDLRGINTGGWGLRLRTEDMAKFGQLFLQKGMWNGKQLLPAEWITEASTAKIDQAPDMPQSKKDSSDWTQGYCYQMWRCRHNAFRADGAFGQFIIIMPDQDAVIAINAEVPSMQDEINLVWNYLLPAMQNGELEENAQTVADLRQKLSSLAIPALSGSNDSEVAGEISGKTFTLTPNPGNLESISFTFSNNECRVSEKIKQDVYENSYGSGTWRTGDSKKPGPSLVGGALTNTTFLYPAKVAGSYTWKDKNTLELVLRYIESPHSEILICRFDHNRMEADLMKSLDYGRQKVTLTGTINK